MAIRHPGGSKLVEIGHKWTTLGKNTIQFVKIQFRMGGQICEKISQQIDEKIDEKIREKRVNNWVKKLVKNW